ncbi:Transcriptional regulator, ArsR family [Thioalkalivibrio nitratireducens DSM 14787]|uniref:Transcriptional regulator, ArsR family n=1 Tax=Thioalkalivibrio nitratireducens (strain DSM 14787 / UNIQEM 213 / ALEN2) TaxID=1255043 RepID=L0DYF3_THIND|nr:metalloregulator ArsR/SmtB family transcription factor [Thioalkalivibrio nitratireducens]AGA33371.1 Transcriptional regulator, ArsR family [Thioalkalivibrio nitratireducens DSM 14787]
MNAIEPSSKTQLFTHFARVAKALASPVRLELLEALAQSEHSVDELARAAGVPMANASHHLQVLRDGGLVRSRRDGVQVIYSLSDETEITQVIAGIRRIAEAQLAEVDRIVREAFTSRDTVTPMDPREVMKLARRGEVTVIDVRPRDEFHSGHIKGAINIPLEELGQHLAELPRDREIVTYCRGPYCVLSFDAVEELRRHGFRARRLEAGYPEWRAARLPVARATR